MELRWHIVETTVTTWDDRDKEWYSHKYQTAPVLQFKLGEVWVDVPTVVTPRE